MAELPLGAAELARRLSMPLVPGDEPELTVLDVRLASGTGSPPSLILQVRAQARGQRAEEWQVTLPTDLADLDGSTLEVGSFVTTVRANLEEWAHVRDTDPHVRSWGRRVG